jgi:hypothetical protein
MSEEVKVANEMAAPEKGNAPETKVETQGTAQVVTPSVETKTTDTTQTAVTGQTIQTPPVEEWKPDFKLKVMDKEFEWNEHLKKVATKDNFNELKEIHEKAYGLPFVKERLESIKEENKRLKEVETHYGKTQEYVNGLSTMLDKKDYFNFFNQVGLKDQDIINYALQRVKYHELPQEEKQVYDEKFQSSKRLYELEKQNQFLANQFQAQQVNARQAELNSFLQKEDVRPIAEAFDSRVGQPGAFMQEVIRRGQLAYFQKGIDLPVADAVKEVTTFFGSPIQQQTMAAPTQAMPTQQFVKNDKPVIPNVKGGAQSPARKVVRSIADLKSIAQQV